MKNAYSFVAIVLLLFGLQMPAQASIIVLHADLSGANEAPTPVISPGAGTADVILDDVAQTLDVTLVWADLTGPAVASHIHCCAPPGTNAAVRVPFAIANSASGTFQNLFSLTSIPGTPALTVSDFLDALVDGQGYVNIHTAQFPGGEIRGQLLPVSVPEPATLALFGIGLAGLGFARRRATN